ncbi:MAG TPA: hypothetical protein VJ723_02775 [Candidatus Angelobacter sp.]|nr:hypothetical protein [Candidatus Angelobacter sp.]
MKTILVRFAITFLVVSGALAQSPALPAPKAEYLQRMASEPEGQVNFLATELAGAGEPVKGAPYTATAIIESSQTLADGNRIVHKSSGLIARDSEGRMRREETIQVGPLQVDGLRVIFINDPVSKTNYVLNPDTKVARVVKLEMGPEVNKIKLEAEKRKLGEKTTGAPYDRRGGLKTESLGTQVVEGVSCEGQRITRTIPAGAIGNERPIEMVVESWESPELHLAVVKKRIDPRTGEYVYRLTDIHRGEPDTSLFQIPSGYTMEKGVPRMPPPPPPGGAKE